MERFHTPVLLRQTLELLAPKPGETVVDGTVGGGGHAAAILEKILPGGRLIGIDRDQQALDFAAERLSAFGDAVTLVKANFRDIDQVLADLGIPGVNGILFDTGVSAWQLESGRGFSFTDDGALDMRMDTSEPRTAADLVNELPEREIARILRENADERWAVRIARAIARERAERRIERARDLADIVASAIPRRAWPRKIHPATKCFMALRAEVNEEFGSLRIGLKRAVEALLPGGRLAVITFESTGDRIAKATLAELAGRCVCDRNSPVCTCGAKPVIRVLTKSPVRPDEAETSGNPRSRSARLRAAVKI